MTLPVVPSLGDLSLEDLQQCGLSESDSKGLLSVVKDISANSITPVQEVWRIISQKVLSPKHPFSLHLLLFSSVYRNWDAAKYGRPPVWSPTAASARSTNLGRFMHQFRETSIWNHRTTGDVMNDYPLLHHVSVECPEDYWRAVVEQFGIRFHTQPSRMLQYGSHADSCRWLPGGMLNIASNALQCDTAPAPAILWAREETPTCIERVSYAQLQHQCYRVAVALRSSGIKPGDAVALVLPLTVEAVLAYLGVLLLGGSVVSIAESFAPQEIATRMKVANAKAVITQDVIRRGGKSLPLYPRCLSAVKQELLAVVVTTGATGSQGQLRGGDAEWNDILSRVSDADVANFRPVVCPSHHTIGVLFSSGTTGEPKAIPWLQTTALKCAADGWAHQDIRCGDVVCWPTSMGWMMGPWLIFASLLNKGCVALYYGAPQGRGFASFVSHAGVNMLGCVPSLVKAWRATDALQDVHWGSIRAFSSTGEASTAEDSHWLSSRAGYAPVIEYCGGTEIGGGFLSGSMVQPAVSSTFSTPTLGTTITLITPDGHLSPHGSHMALTGELAVVAPALGMSQSLLNKDHYSVYYKGMPSLGDAHRWLRRHGDEVERLSSGYYHALGRTDDTMNLGGIKVSSVELERCCVSGVEGVVEAAAVGISPPGGGPQQLVLFLVTNPGGNKNTDQLKAECQAAIRAKLNPLFKVDKVLMTASLPRNAGNKVMRRVLRDMLHTAAKF